MPEFFYKIEWLPILISHENDLVFDSFSRDDALSIGNEIVRLAKVKYNGSVAVCIYEDDMQIFSHKMQGTDMGNDIWMFRKINTSKLMGMSSIRALVEIESGISKANWKGREESFVACGGCYPVNIKGSKPYVYILVSGLEHYLDHQIIIDAVCAHLNVDLPSIST